MRPSATARLLAVLAFCLLFLTVTVPARAAERVVVRFAAGATAADRADLREQAGADLVRGAVATPATQLLAADTPAAAERAVERLEASEDVVWAERDVPVRAAATPDDPRFAEQYWLGKVAAPAAWDVTTGDPAVTVAVVDTGVAPGHPDLVPNLWRNAGETGGGRETNGRDDDGNGFADDVRGWDFVAGDAAPDDHEGHGTHVAATIAGRGNDRSGGAGVAWRSRVLPLRALDAVGSGYASDVALAIAYAARAGARVVNLSISGAYSEALDDAIAAHPEVLVVTAAGNDGRSVDGDWANAYPCRLTHPNVVCVGATGDWDVLEHYSNQGATSVDLAAPGGGVLAGVPARRTAFADDFEAAGRWGMVFGFTRTSAPAGTRGQVFAATLAAAGPPVAQAQTSQIDWGQGRCSGTARTWFLPERDGERLVLGDTAGAALLDQRVGGGTFGDVSALDQAALDGLLGTRRALTLSLERGADPRVLSGTVDDLEVTCVVPGAPTQGADLAARSGTSMAAGVVSGAAALVLARRPDAPVASVRAALLGSVDRSEALAGRVATGGRLNVARALAAPLAAPTQPVAPAPAPAPEAPAPPAPDATPAPAPAAPAPDVTIGPQPVAAPPAAPAAPATAAAPFVAGSSSSSSRVVAPARVRITLRRTGGRLVARLRCAAGGPACRGRVEVRAGGKTRRGPAFTVAAGREKTISLGRAPRAAAVTARAADGRVLARATGGR
jgi:subtilisin family serine protease